MKEYVCVNGKGETWKLLKENILYIRQEQRYVVIQTREGEIKRWRKMKDMFPDLEEDKSIHRCHSYCLINFDCVNGMKDSVVYFEGGKTMYLGINSFRQVRKALKHDFFHFLLCFFCEVLENNRIRNNKQHKIKGICV